MKYYLCSVYDNAAKAYNNPMPVPAKGIAIRGFMDEANRPDQQNTLYQHPEDFTLYCIGEFDNESGEVKNYNTHEVLMQGRNAKRETPHEQ